jgi:hypothetical protein
LQPARFPPEGGCAAGAAACQDPRVPTRRGRSRSRTPEGARPESSSGSPRRGAFAFATCCRFASRLVRLSPTRRSGTAERRWLGGPEGTLCRGRAWARAPRRVRPLGPEASRSSEEERWRLDVLSFPLRGAVRRAPVSAALPEGGVASAFARGRVRWDSEEPRCLWPAAQDQACLGIVLHLRRVETEDLVGPSAEAGGSSWSCPSARPVTEVLGPPLPPKWVGRVSVPASRDRREVGGAEAP